MRRVKALAIWLAVSIAGCSSSVAMAEGDDEAQRKSLAERVAAYSECLRVGKFDAALEYLLVESRPAAEGKEEWTKVWRQGRRAMRFRRLVVDRITFRGDEAEVTVRFEYRPGLYFIPVGGWRETTSDEVWVLRDGVWFMDPARMSLSGRNIRTGVSPGEQYRVLFWAFERVAVDELRVPLEAEAVRSAEYRDSFPDCAELVPQRVYVFRLSESFPIDGWTTFIEGALAEAGFEVVSGPALRNDLDDPAVRPPLFTIAFQGPAARGVVVNRMGDGVIKKNRRGGEVIVAVEATGGETSTGAAPTSGSRP